MFVLHIAILDFPQHLAADTDDCDEESEYILIFLNAFVFTGLMQARDSVGIDHISPRAIDDAYMLILAEELTCSYQTQVLSDCGGCPEVLAGENILG